MSYTCKINYISCCPEIEGETEERPQETDDEGIERDSSDADVDEISSQKSNDMYEERSSVYSLKNVMQVSKISKYIFYLLYHIYANNIYDIKIM